MYVKKKKKKIFYKFQDFEFYFHCLAAEYHNIQMKQIFGVTCQVGTIPDSN